MPATLSDVSVRAPVRFSDRPAAPTVRRRAVTVLLGGCGAVFIAMLILAVHGTNRFDLRVERRVRRVQSAGGTRLFRDVTRLGETGVAIAVTVAVVIALLVLRRYALGLLVSASVALSAALTLFFKWAVGRSRPNPAWWLGDARGNAFPSGHTAKAAALYWSLAVVATVRWRRRYAVVAWLAASAAVGAVAASRVYLGVHWASDVAGGAALAAVVVGCTWRLIERVAPSGGGAP